MRHIAITTCIAFSAALFSCNDAAKDGSAAGTDTTGTTAAPTASPSDTVTTTPSQPMDSAQMMQAWQAYMTPGDMHKLMASQAGSWKEEMTMWMDPKAPPAKSVGTMTCRMILGGRYQETKHSTTVNNMPFEGVGYTAFDNSSKKFISSWMDNMGTGLMTTEGTYDEASKTLTMSGDMKDPYLGKMVTMRQVMTLIDATHYTFQMYCKPSGEAEYQTMEIKYTKK